MGKPVLLESQAMILNGSICTAGRFISEALGATLSGLSHPDGVHHTSQEAVATPESSDEAN